MGFGTVIIFCSSSRSPTPVILSTDNLSFCPAVLEFENKDELESVDLRDSKGKDFLVFNP